MQRNLHTDSFLEPAARSAGPRWSLTVALGLGLLLGACAPAPTPKPEPENRALGDNVKVFDPSMSTDQIQAAVSAIHKQQVDAEFGTGRYALMFKPGTYGTPEKPLLIDVGYYTEVVGLGRSPGDVVINGHVSVYNRCLGTDDKGNPSNCIALNNFWRSASNLTIKVAGGKDCQAVTNFWAASQAAPMRRVDVNGKFSLMDYCSAGPQFASGGYIADSRVTGTDVVVSGSQQQYIIRNSEIPGWSNGVWNQVFSGVKGAPATSFATTGPDGKPANPYTTLPTTPVSREKPYLYLDAAGEYQVFVPGVKTDSSGVSWANGPESGGKTLPLSGFFIARPGDQVATINSALSAGRGVLFTPGMYDIDQTLLVNKPGTVLLGLGLATLTAQGGTVPMKVGDVSGVSLAGLTIDAGPVNSPVLLQIGNKGGAGGNASDPVALHDVFFRIGGPGVGKATISLIVNSNNTVLDHIWAWRADHGDGVGWTVNTADHGVIINGDDVTATGLFVEHYQKEQLIWNGERGQVVLYQNEMPYDPPTQAAWMNGALLGYPAYKVNDSVNTHQAWGLGSYIFIESGADIHATHGFEVPKKPGVKLTSLLTVQLNVGHGTIDHVVNQTGPATIPPAEQKEGSTVVSLKQYPQ